MKRLNGYRDISDFKIINKPIGDSMFAKFWLSDSNSLFLFKQENEYLAYKEIFYSLLVRKLKINSVTYDLASYNNKFGVISKNYCKGNKSFSVTQVLNDYWDDVIEIINKYHNYSLVNNITFEYCFNVLKLPKLIFDYVKKYHMILGEDLRKKLLEAFIVQILLGNNDLTSKNMELFEEDKIVKFSPLFDFGNYGEIDLAKNKSSYRFQFSKIPNDEVFLPKGTIRVFMKVGSKEDIRLFKEYLYLVKRIRLNYIFEEIEENTCCFIPEYIKLSLKRRVVKNIKDVSEILKN